MHYSFIHYLFLIFIKDVDVDAEAEEVLNELNLLTEGEDPSNIGRNIQNDGSDWGSNFGMFLFSIKKTSNLLI